MPSSECKKENVSKHELEELALDFLKAIARMSQTELERPPQRLQQSRWMVSTGPGTMQNKIYERSIIDSEKIRCNYFFEYVHENFPEKVNLQSALGKIGKSNTDLDSRLLENWLKLPNPFSFDEEYISRLLDEFADVVLDNKMTTTSLTAIDNLDVANLPISLEDGIVIREITKDELWEFGDLDVPLDEFPLSIPQSMPNEKWKVLDIEVLHDMSDSSAKGGVSKIRDAVLTFLRLVSSGLLDIIDLGIRYNYGSPSGTRSMNIVRRSIGRCKNDYTLSAEITQNLRGSWPSIRKIMESDSHYLRLPAQRLFDGSEREKYRMLC